ncbi:MAG TPA: HTTM domain-containing protein [Thermoanaerobaculia bacterium]|nr:HTTM domain-containing protein [Thermoanaerobaculia bacterium]
MLFGAIMLWEVCRYFNKGWIERYFITPPFHPGYFGFEWVAPLSGSGMYAVFAALGVLAACILTGFAYRWAAPLFFLGFTYVFLLDATRYLNHFYLIVLVSFLLAVLPAHRDFSIDAWRNPAIRAGFMPAWMLGLLRLQIGIPYFYGGLAKLSPDWLRGEPMRMWLAQRTGFPLIGPFFTQDWMVYAFVYGGLLLDLLAVPMLLWPRTRKLALVLLALFHLLNARLFVIGIFPWMMLAAALIFLPPATLRPKTLQAPQTPQTPAGTVRNWPRWALALVAVYAVLQLLVPLRHLLYPGDTNWTEEGHRFSWHMKLRDKEGMVLFSVEDSEGTRLVNPDEYLLPHQAAKLVNGPDLILQLAHHIAADYRRRGHRDVKVHAIAMASLNGRKPQPLIDPAVDLAARSRSLRPSPWIVPLR